MLIFDSLRELANALVLENIRKDGPYTLYDIRNASDGDIRLSSSMVLSPGEVLTETIDKLAWEEIQESVVKTFEPIPPDPRLSTTLGFELNLGTVTHIGAVGVTEKNLIYVASNPYEYRLETVLSATHDIILGDGAAFRSNVASDAWAVSCLSHTYSQTSPNSITASLAGTEVGPNSPVVVSVKFEEAAKTTRSAYWSSSVVGIPNMFNEDPPLIYGPLPPTEELAPPKPPETRPTPIDPPVQVPETQQ